MSPEEQKKLVNAWLQHNKNRPSPGNSNGESTKWALDNLICECDENPELGFSLILQILEKSPSDWALGMLAAGPLEDLIS